MGIKRPSSELPPQALDKRPPPSKRIRLTPTKDLESNSSDPSTCSVSEDSALRSSPLASEHTRNSSLESTRISIDTEDDGSDSSLLNSRSSSSSSDGDDDDSEDADDEDMATITTIGAPSKPPIRPSNLIGRASDLRARLASLLPRMAEANEQLKNGEMEISMEDVEDGERHIEMDLGLGVLEEKRDDTSSESESSEDGEADGDKERDVLGRLMGQERKDGGARIESLA